MTDAIVRSEQPMLEGDGAPPLVGRERELTLLWERLAAALAGRGGLVLLGGEAGIGKTALAEALGAEAVARGAPVLVGHCYDLSETPPYGPWTELFEEYQATAAATGQPAPPALLTRGGGEEAGSQEALFARVREFLAAVAGRRPLVLLLDDLHWADPASLDLLRFVARRLAALPLLVVAAYRADELTRRHPLYQLLPTLVREARATRLDLKPLSEADVQALVAKHYRLASPNEARLVGYLQQHAEGNPFYLGELLRTLGEEGLLRGEGDSATLGDLDRARVPPLLRQVIDARLARLGEEARGLLAIGAVIGQEVPLRLWQAVSEAGEEILLDVAERAGEARLLEATDADMRFVHALIREALYEGILPLRRRGWHLRVAERLAGSANSDPDEVAYHFRQANDVRAVEWLVRAGERALRSYAWQTAGERYEAALALMEASDANAGERGWLLYRLGRMRRFADPRRAIGYFEEAERLARAAGDHALAATARCDQGVFRWALGEWSRGLSELAAGVEALEALPPEEHARLNRQDTLSSSADVSARRGTLVWGLAALGRYAEALAMGETYLACTPAPTPGGARGASAYADACMGLGVAHAMLARPREARAAFARARDAYRTVEHFLNLGRAVELDLGMALLTYHPERLAERERLAAEAEQALARASSAGVASLAPRFARLALLALEGDWAEARTLALVVPTAIGAPIERWVAMALLGLLAREQGEPELAWAQVHEVLPAGPTTAPGDAPFHGAVAFQRLAAALTIEGGDLTTARAWLEAHDRWLAWAGAVLGQAEGHLGWAAYHRAAGDLAQAHRHAERALACAGEPRQPLALLAAHRLLGELDTQASGGGPGAPPPPRGAGAGRRLRRPLRARADAGGVGGTAGGHGQGGRGPGAARRGARHLHAPWRQAGTRPRRRGGGQTRQPAAGTSCPSGGADGAGGGGAPPGRPGAVERRGGGAALPQPAHRQRAPHRHLRQAGRHLAQCRRPLRPRPRPALTVALASAAQPLAIPRVRPARAAVPEPGAYPYPPPRPAEPASRYFYLPATSKFAGDRAP